MKTKKIVLISSFLFLSLLTFIRFDIHQNNEQTNRILPDSLKIIAESSWNNLQVFIIEGDEKAANKNYIILSEALKKEYATIKETSQVNELSINNNSQYYIFIHSGDIVKGGRQDRTISYDVIIPPKAKDVPLSSFCVESNRWAKRGEESDQEFSENSVILSSRKLKVASKVNNNQSQVWSEVAAHQQDLSANVGYMNNKSIDITNNESATSLQLSLENKDLDSIRNSYKKHFESLPEKYPKAIGFAYAINGEVYGIEIYNNKKLFNDLWNKLIDASIVESVSEMVKDTVFENATKEDIAELMTKVLDAKKEVKEINSETVLHTFKLKDAVLFTTIDKSLNKWIHKNYIAVDTTITATNNQDIHNNELRINSFDYIDIQQIQQNTINQE